MRMEPNKRPLDEGFEEDEQSNKRFRTDFEMMIAILLMNREVGQVIGKGGENIKAIRNESGARVNVQNLIPNAFERIADVTGGVEQVSQAVQMIATSLSESAPCITLLAESRNLGPVIGKGGSTINQIRNDTRANVSISKECKGNSSQKEIRISGNPEGVFQAIDSVVKLLAEGTSHVRVPYVPHGGGSFGPPMMGMGGKGMGGRGGRGGYNRGGGFNRPMYGNGGRPYPSGPYQSGPDSRQGLAQLPPSGLHIETNVLVPKEMVGKIIGRGGSNINTIRNQSGATIVVAPGEDDQPERKITITGDRQAMDIACSMIETLASRFY